MNKTCSAWQSGHNRSQCSYDIGAQMHSNCQFKLPKYFFYYIQFEYLKSTELDLLMLSAISAHFSAATWPAVTFRSCLMALIRWLRPCGIGNKDFSVCHTSCSRSCYGPYRRQTSRCRWWASRGLRFLRCCNWNSFCSGFTNFNEF